MTLVVDVKVQTQEQKDMLAKVLEVWQSKFGRVGGTYQSNEEEGEGTDVEAKTRAIQTIPRPMTPINRVERSIINWV
ncbi:hypothetical protein M427DRAFT_135659 [Gonapodya prolifera JEL478]|uniref:Uncharacterized protein n=1 Tax=Gonapodya prolifera (strain JEL478) TaxID=1344416 RepID=A0A139ADK1_GONPJ|nr:hypothetical protein M427DRAFT_135659 [Gonapodya prolifera JEL478]|eukprot:KXS14515.1 hypothetical protein M427DRAFT_135659 [Gonapodya prolifera JEL478]